MYINRLHATDEECRFISSDLSELVLCDWGIGERCLSRQLWTADYPWLFNNV